MQFKLLFDLRNNFHPKFYSIYVKIIYLNLFKSLISLVEDVGLELFILDCARVVGINDLEEWVDIFSLHGNFQLGYKIGHLIDGQTIATLKVEIVEDLSKKGWVISSQLKDSSSHLSDEMLHGGLGSGGIFILWHLPDGLHHSHEVLLAWRVHGEISVVVVPLLPSDNTIIITSSSIEVIEEF